MRYFYSLTLALTFFLLSACTGLTGQDDSTTPLPTRLVLPTTTPEQPSTTLQAETTSPAAPNSAFAWFPNPDDHTVLGVDSQNQSVTTKILTTFNPSLVTSTTDEVWVTQDVDEKITSLLRIDRRTGIVSDDIPIQYGRATSISVEGNYVWLTMQSPTSVKGEMTGGVVQVDINQRRFLRYIETSGYPLQVVATPQAAWVLEQDVLTTHFESITPSNGQTSPIPASVQNSADLQLFARFAINSSGMWAIPQQPFAPYIFHLDPQTGHILTTIKVGDTPNEHPIDIAAGNNAVYIALENNSIVTLNPNNGFLSDPVSIGVPINWLTVMDQDVWVWSYPAATAYQMDGSRNRLLGSVVLGSTPVPTPTVVSYPTPSIMGGAFKPCEGVDFESNLRPGMKAIVNPDPPLPDRVRISASRTGTVVDVVKPNHWMEILEGPACVEGKIWWKVHTQNNIIGWTMEGDGIDHWLLPTPETK